VTRPKGLSKDKLRSCDQPENGLAKTNQEMNVSTRFGIVFKGGRSRTTELAENSFRIFDRRANLGAWQIREPGPPCSQRSKEL